jgi:hypothetical protein
MMRPRNIFICVSFGLALAGCSPSAPEDAQASMGDASQSRDTANAAAVAVG